MPKRSGNKDVNQIAAGIVARVGQADVKAFMREMGRRGGLKGGKVRAARMSKAELSASASKAARARWAKEKG